MRKTAAIVIWVLLVAFPSFAETITADTKWSGNVTVKDDVLVARGATLTIAAGSKILFAEAVSTKTDPAFWSPQTEIAVNGKLIVEGTEQEPVSFEPETGYFGGIIAAPGSEVRIRGARIARAEEGLLAAGGSMEVSESEITGCETGIVVNAGAMIFQVEKVKVTSCKVGLVDMRHILSTGRMSNEEREVSVNRHRQEALEKALEFRDIADANFLFTYYGTSYHPNRHLISSGGGKEREFVGDYTVDGLETWTGTIIISGRVTVPPGSMLTVEKGTRVRFRKKDTNGDGLGEGELLVTGSIRVKGTQEYPVVFESAEEKPEAGDWDKVSVISSDDPDNSFENALFRHGMQALHGHFSQISVKQSIFTENLRAVQFQESDKTTLDGCWFFNNKQAVRFRDSKVMIKDCEFGDNDYAVHAFRGELEFLNSRVEDARLGGVLAKECKISVRDSSFTGSRNALKVKGEGSEVFIKNNTFTKTAESLLSFSGAKGELTGNKFEKSGLDLVGVEDSPLVFRDNTFGISNRHSIHLKGSTGIDAAQNWWNPQSPPEKSIYDRNDDSSLGLVTFEPAKEWAARPH